MCTEGSKRNRLLLLTRIIVVSVVSVVFAGWAAYYASIRCLQYTPVHKADVIVLLAGNREERTPAAAYLYHNGYADRVLLTNDGVFSSWSRENNRNLYQVEWTEEDLVRLGVPRDNIVKLDFIESGTMYDALAFRNFLYSNKNIKSAILVTSNYHLNRALWTFRKMLNNKTVILMGYPANSSKTEIKNIVKENLKLLWYRLKYDLMKGRIP